MLKVSGEELKPLVGPNDINLRLIEEAFGVSLVHREEELRVFGAEDRAAQAADLIADFLRVVRQGRSLTTPDVRYALRTIQRQGNASVETLLAEPIIVTHRGRPVRPKTPGQAAYVKAMQTHDLVFCTGPAGTGKTYLAMAVAMAALRDGKVSRVVLTRPIVQAGEELGFLPGDIMEKVDPYLRPLHDALQDIVGTTRFHKHLERGIIEVIPLAFMRGRTLNDAFIVLDEAQNTTRGQMKMALTRLGFGAQMVITGDITQSDLPPTTPSGMRHALQVLQGLKGIAFVELTGDDIVRHDLVQRIVRAYDSAEHDLSSRTQQGCE